MQIQNLTSSLHKRMHQEEDYNSQGNTAIVCGKENQGPEFYSGHISFCTLDKSLIFLNLGSLICKVRGLSRCPLGFLIRKYYSCTSVYLIATESLKMTDTRKKSPDNSVSSVHTSQTANAQICFNQQ